MPTDDELHKSKQTKIKMEDFKNLNIDLGASIKDHNLSGNSSFEILRHDDLPISKPLSRVSSACTQQALNFNQDLHKICNLFHGNLKNK